MAGNAAFGTLLTRVPDALYCRDDEHWAPPGKPMNLGFHERCCGLQLGLSLWRVIGPVSRRCLRIDPRGLAVMGYRLSLAAVVAAALFAVAWVLCDQLADLGVGGSSAAAGVLAIVVFGLMARVTRPNVRVCSTSGPRTPSRTAWARRSVLGRATCSLGQSRGPARAEASCRSGPGLPDGQRMPGTCACGTERS